MPKYHSRISLLVLFCLFSLLFLLFSFTLVALSGTFRSAHGVFEGGEAGPTVIIDAGHGGEDGGAVGINGCFEKDINLSVAKKLKNELDALGVRCVLTRSDDSLLYDKNADYEGRKKRLDMQERLRIATSYDNAVFVSIHQNSFSVEKYSGLQIYYSKNHTTSKLLADAISSAVKKQLQPDNDRLSKPSAGNIYLLDRLSCPALLIECGFISNSSECTLLCTDEYQSRLCAVMASAICAYFNSSDT